MKISLLFGHKGKQKSPKPHYAEDAWKPFLFSTEEIKSDGGGKKTNQKRRTR